MNLKQLSYFVTVVETGSISKAAKILHMSQPPLSRHMKLLEEDLNVILFKRTNNKIQLTKAGEELYRKAYDLLTLAQKTESEIKSIVKNEEKILQIGTVSSSTQYLVSKDMDSYLAKHHLKLSIHEGNTYQLIELLNHRIIDLAICRTPFSYDYYVHKSLVTEPMCVVSKKKIEDLTSIIALDNLPLIIYRRFKAIIQSLFDVNQVKLNIKVEVDDAKSAIMWVQTGVGYAIVPYSIFQAMNVPNLCYNILSDRELETTLTAIHRKGEKEKEVLDFIQFL